MIGSILKCCIFSTVIQIVLCVEGPFNDDINVIRIQNNGSEIRTIYLPKQPSSSSSKTLKYYKKTNDSLHGHKFVRVTHFGNHDSHIQKPHRTLKNQTAENSCPDSLKDSVKMQKSNTSDLYQETPSLKIWRKRPLKNTVPTKKSGVEIKVSADKIAKLLNIFTIVNFTNDQCDTEDGSVGVCYHASECTILGGEPRGPCAQGFGVCCFVSRTCDESSAVNNTYFTSSRVAQDTATGVYVCSVVIYKAHPDVVQLRLTFENFQLAGPVEGNCIVDRFLVTGQNQNDIVPPICGFNNGKHVYINVDESEGPVTLTLLSSGAQGVPRDLRVRVTQLTRDHPLLAPNNCLQYFTEPSGSVESFNYIPATATSSTFSPGYFNNLNYAICFKKTAGLCGIVYSNTDAKEYTFEIVNKENDGTSTVPEGQAGAESFDCPDDFLSTSTIRLCGYRFNDGSSTVDYTRDAPVNDNTNGPLILRFRTNQNETGRGFHLDYMLTPCYSTASWSAGETSTGSSVPLAATRAPFLT